jgi:hypothetical protein
MLRQAKLMVVDPVILQSARKHGMITTCSTPTAIPTRVFDLDA